MRPAGSLISRQMMRPPNRTFWRFSSCPASMRSPSDRSDDVVDQNRRAGHERRADKVADDAAHAANDDDEHHLERAVEIETARVDRAEIGKGPKRTGDSDRTS